MKFTIKGLGNHFKKNKLGYEFINITKEKSLDRLENCTYIDINFSHQEEKLTLFFEYGIDREGYYFISFKLIYDDLMKNYHMDGQPEYHNQLDELLDYMKKYLDKCILRDKL